MPGVCITGANAAEAHARPGGGGLRALPLKAKTRATDRTVPLPRHLQTTLTTSYRWQTAPRSRFRPPRGEGMVSSVQARNHEVKPFDLTANHRKMALPKLPLPALYRA